MRLKLHPTHENQARAPENRSGEGDRPLRKLSLFTLVLSAISLCVAVYLPISLVMDIEDTRTKVTLDREKKLKLYVQTASSLYRAGAEKEIDALLEEALAQKDINYYMVYRDGLLIYAKPVQDDLLLQTPYRIRKSRAGRDFIDANFSERNELLSDDTLLTLGIDKRHGDYIYRTVFQTDVWKVIVQDIIMVIALSALAFWLHTRDLARLRKEIDDTGRIQLNPKHALSAESEAITAGLMGLQNQEDALTKGMAKLSSQVLPALRRELFSGKEPPYAFDCTLVRTDINGFSQIFNSPYRDRFSEHINDFLEGLSEIASRYDGLIYEFIGDEAIYYFKDKKPYDSIEVALHAVRDIHDLAREINAKTKSEGHQFTVKSALSHGTLLFARQVDGFSLSGGVLIESVRILSLVTEKDDNTLYLSDRHLKHLVSQDQFEAVGNFELKGYSDRVTLHRWLGDAPVSYHLTQTEQQGFEFIQNYRSDKAILETIESVIQNFSNTPLERQLGLINHLRSLFVYRVRYRLAPSLLSWADRAVERSESEPEWQKIVSGVLMLIPRLVPSGGLLEHEADRLEKFLDAKDPRTVANTVEILRVLKVTPKARPIPGFFASEHNRIAANALVHAGSRDFSKDVVYRLYEMILDSTNDDARRASGLFALGEIARLLKNHDPVYFASRVELHRLLRQAERFEEARNASVATQARNARIKAMAS